jgi:hypothetical protein
VWLSGAQPSNWLGRKNDVSMLFGAMVAGGLLLVAAGVASPGSLAAREELPVTADPAGCTVEPRALPLWDGTPAGVQDIVQPDPAGGESADDATIRGLTSTVVESAACANAGQPLRALALVTDDFLARQFVGDNAADVTESGARLQRPAPEPDPSDFLTVVAVEDVVTYPDGTVGAVVTSENADGTFRDYVVFVEGDTRWLIEASFPIVEGAGTPEA